MEAALPADLRVSGSRCKLTEANLVGETLNPAAFLLGEGEREIAPCAVFLGEGGRELFLLGDVALGGGLWPTKTAQGLEGMGVRQRGAAFFLSAASRSAFSTAADRTAKSLECPNCPALICCTVTARACSADASRRSGWSMLFDRLPFALSTLPHSLYLVIVLSPSTGVRLRT